MGWKFVKPSESISESSSIRIVCPLWHKGLFAQDKEPCSLRNCSCTYMQSPYVSLNLWFGDTFVLQCIFILLIMARKNTHTYRPARSHLLKRVVGFVTACALLFWIWFNAGSEGQLRKSFGPLSKQAETPSTPAASALAGDQQPDVDAEIHKVTTPSRNISSQAPFPTLPPPDNEEYMAICMAGKYL